MLYFPEWGLRQFDKILISIFGYTVYILPSEAKECRETTPADSWALQLAKSSVVCQSELHKKSSVIRFLYQCM